MVSGSGPQPARGMIIVEAPGHREVELGEDGVPVVRRLQLEIIEENGERNPIWVAAHPIEKRGYAPGNVWSVVGFFAEYLIQNWREMHK